MVKRVGLLLAVCAFGRASSTWAQSDTIHPLRRTIGLALSGGAARGLSHIGVLKLLEQAGIPVDVVAGTSMGSIIAGLHAVGYSSVQIEHIVKTAGWTRLLTDPVSRRELPVNRKASLDRYLLSLPVVRGRIQLPRSVVAGQRISQMLTLLTWPVDTIRDFRSLPTPFAAVATDLETGAAVILDHGILSEAIRASMAIPSVFAPVEIDGHVLIDGGVVRNLPAQDARALGADFLICSDVTDPLEHRDSVVTFVDALVQSVSFRIWDSEERQRKLCDVLIQPDVRAFPSFGFGRLAELVARGEAAARAALPRIHAALSRSSLVREPRATVPPADSVLVAAVQFEHSDRVPGRFLGGVLDVPPPTWSTRQELDQAVDRLYATGLFETVQYRLAPLPDGPPQRRELTVIVKERAAGRFGIGLRYDSRYKASTLASVSRSGLFGFGTSGQVDVRLGQQIRVGVAASQSLGDRATLTLGTGAEYVRSPFDLYTGGQRTAELRVNLGALTASVTKSLGTTLAGSVRVKAEFAQWDDVVSAVELPAIRRTFYSATGEFDVDTYDRGVLPTRGVGVRVLSEWGNRILGAGRSFSHHFADVQGYLPVYPTISIWGDLTVGATGGDPPPHYQFYLGGANNFYLFPDRAISFVGLQTQERRGRHLQKLEAGAQWEFLHGIFARVRWNGGNVFDRWPGTSARYVGGVGFELNAKTFAGRLNLSVAGRGVTTWPGVSIDLGYPF